MAGAEAQTRSGIARLRLLGVLAALAPGPAFAGAWVAPEAGQEIWTNVAGQRDGLSFFETSGYWEIPIGERNAVVASPWLEQNYDTADGWRGEATLGLKRALYRGDSSVVAVQAGGFWMSDPGLECEEAGAEVRLLGGAAFGRSGFVNVEAAARTVGGGCTGERVDLTVGYRPGENWLAMGQVFVDAPHDREETVKAQFTVVRFGQRGGLQLGVRSRIDGGAEEAALVLGWWGRPGD